MSDSFINPPVIFAYPNSTPIIKDQSKVATIVARVGHGFSIKGIDLSKMRVSNSHKNKQCIVIDVLPGTYSIQNFYDERIPPEYIDGRMVDSKRTTFEVIVEFRSRTCVLGNKRH